MPLYCGLDVHARSSQLCVIDERDEKLLERKVPNRLLEILAALAPFGPELEIVVESTFNWYWLVDGLREAGYAVCLAHTHGLYLITRAKVKTDRRDAYKLARLLRAGLIPKAYIYPKQTRPIRELVRQRTRIVAQRAGKYRNLRRRLYQQGSLEHSRNGIRELECGDVERLFEDERIRLLARQELARIELLSGQIDTLETIILELARPEGGYLRLCELPGFGRALAAIAFYEIGEIERFPSARAFSSYCRLVPGVAQSSSTSRRGRGAKQGNPHLKSAFTQAAQHAVRHYPTIRRLYERQIRRHRGRASKLIATDIIAHKLAVAAYHMLQEGTDYQERLLFGN